MTVLCFVFKTKTDAYFMERFQPNFQKKLSLKVEYTANDNRIKSKWMIYDSVYTYGDDEEMWVRGITSVHSIELFHADIRENAVDCFPITIILIGAIGYFL